MRWTTRALYSMVLALAFGAFGAARGGTEITPFRRGDVDSGGSRNVSDAVLILKAVFRGGALICAKSADTDDSGDLDVTDAIVLLENIFQRGPALPEPFASCGLDVTPDDGLSCESFPACEK